jgi:DNA end-binding protein Ku
MARGTHGRKKSQTAHDQKSTARARASWRGMLRFGLVAFPVEAFNAHSVEGAPVSLHQLHAECHSRIRYQKTCPVHGTVPNDEIVSGYEYGKGRYVEIGPEELDELRTNAERALTVDAFISPDEIDPIFFDGRMYLLAPDGDAAREPYAIFLEALQRHDRWGVGQVVFSGKQEIVVLRSYQGALNMAMLSYAAEIRNPRDVVPPVPRVASADKKVRLAEQLIESWTQRDFDFAQYHDTYSDKVKELIRAKAEGRELVVPEVEAEPEVINLMDALRKSIGRAGAHQAESRNGRPSRRGHRRAPASRRHAS